MKDIGHALVQATGLLGICRVMCLMGMKDGNESGKPKRQPPSKKGIVADERESALFYFSPTSSDSTTSRIGGVAATFLFIAPKCDEL